MTPPTAVGPHAGCASAMNAAVFASTSAQNAAWNFARSIVRNPSALGTSGSGAASGTGSFVSDATDSPLSGMNAATYTSPTTFGSLPASVITDPPYEWPTRITLPDDDAI